MEMGMGHGRGRESECYIRNVHLCWSSRTHFGGDPAQSGTVYDLIGYVARTPVLAC